MPWTSSNEATRTWLEDGPLTIGALKRTRLPAGVPAPDEVGPDDPAFVWGPLAHRGPVSPPWRETAAFDIAQVAAQMDPDSDDGSRRDPVLEQLCAPLATILAGGECSVLQVGCGVGNWVPFLRERVSRLHYFGLDRSERALTVARARHGALPGVQFIFGDVRTRPVLGRFNLVLLDYELLNHLSLADARLVLAWARDSLTDGGCVFGDIRLGGASFFERRFSFPLHDFGVWYRRGALGACSEGRAAAIYRLSDGQILKLFQDVLRVDTREETFRLWDADDAHAVTLGDLQDLETDKPECRRGVSFLWRPTTRC